MPTRRRDSETGETYAGKPCMKFVGTRGNRDSICASRFGNSRSRPVARSSLCNPERW